MKLFTQLHEVILVQSNPSINQTYICSNKQNTFVSDSEINNIINPSIYLVTWNASLWHQRSRLGFLCRRKTFLNSKNICLIYKAFIFEQQFHVICGFWSVAFRKMRFGHHRITMSLPYNYPCSGQNNFKYPL